MSDSLRGASKELQKLSIVGLIYDPYILSKSIDIINENFYSDSEYKLIYKSLQNHYKKYSVIPSKDELILGATNLYNKDYGDIEVIKNIIASIYSYEVKSSEYIYNCVITFIRRCKLERCLGKAVRSVQSGEIDLDRLGDELRDAVSMSSITRAPIMNLADIDSIDEEYREVIGTDSRPVVIKFFIDAVNKCMQYKGLIPGTVSMVTAPPGRGKTTMLINQGVKVAEQGFNLLHIFLGDMSKLDGRYRYLSCYTGTDTSKLVELSKEGLKKFVQKWNASGIFSYIDIASYAADQLSATQLIEEIYSLQRDRKKHYDVVIIDYDENLSEEEDNMYKSGGQIYNKIALFAVLNRSCVFIASQPRKEFWNQEIIPLEAASESSKKQKIIDLMLTMGKPSKSSDIGTLYIAKNRRGEDCKVIRLKINGRNARMEHITEDEYIRIRNEEKSSK